MLLQLTLFRYRRNKRISLGFYDRASCANCEEREREKTNRCNNQMFIINFCLNMFRSSLCPSSGQQKPCVTACGVLRWFCWMWLVAVVGRCVVGCEYSTVHGLCCPEDGHNDDRNMLRQIVASCWFSLSLHNKRISLWQAVSFRNTFSPQPPTHCRQRHKIQLNGQVDTHATLHTEPRGSSGMSGPPSCPGRDETCPCRKSKPPNAWIGPQY